MGNLIVGFLLGVAATTIGFSGLAKVADSATHQVQKIMIEGAKGQ
jgi:hypothetical protein